MNNKHAISIDLKLYLLHTITMINTGGIILFDEFINDKSVCWDI